MLHFRFKLNLCGSFVSRVNKIKTQVIGLENYFSSSSLIPVLHLKFVFDFMSELFKDSNVVDKYWCMLKLL